MPVNQTAAFQGSFGGLEGLVAPARAARDRIRLLSRIDEAGHKGCGWTAIMHCHYSSRES
jgi:hypothetical protein